MKRAAPKKNTGEKENRPSLLGCAVVDETPFII